MRKFLSIIGLQQDANVEDARSVGSLHNPVASGRNDGAFEARSGKRASGNRHDDTAITSRSQVLRRLSSSVRSQEFRLYLAFAAGQRW